MFFEVDALARMGRYRESLEAAERGLARAEQSGNTFIGFGLEFLYWAGAGHSGRAAESVGPLTRLAHSPFPNVAAQSGICLARVLVLMERRRRWRRSPWPTTLWRRPAGWFRSKPARTRPWPASSSCSDDLSIAWRPRIERSRFPYITRATSITCPSPARRLSRPWAAPKQARAALREARDGVLRVAATLDPEDGPSFLTNVDANVRTLALAQEWLGE